MLKQQKNDLSQRWSAPTLQRPHQSSGRGRWRLWLISLAIAVGIGLLSLWATLRTRYADRFLPNMFIHGLSVDALTPADARAALDQHLGAWQDRPVLLIYGTRQWQPTLAELGVSLDLDQTIQSAIQPGGSALLALLPADWQTPQDVPVQISIDQTQMQRYLHSLAPAINQAPQNASLVIGRSGATLISARNGHMLLVDETLAELSAPLTSLEPAVLRLRTERVAPVLQDAAVAEARDLINHLLSQPLTLRGGDQTWTLSQDELRPLIRIRPGQPGATLRVELEPAIIEQRLAAIAPQIARPAINPRLHFSDGVLSISKPGQTARQLDIPASLAAINAQLNQPEHTIDLVITETEPAVNPATLATLGIREPVGIGRSSFKDSAPYRVQNIKAGTALLDGLVIAPGAEFSFNNSIGRIDATTGFTEGYAIVRDRTQLEYGGGICQDSTTLFRAAFYAGLPFTEWHHHSFRISWYEIFEPYGMDATIFLGASDLRFINDTGHWLLIQTAIDETSQEMSYTLYGTRPNREVIRTNPVVADRQPAPVAPVYIADPKIPPGQFKQTDKARDGMTITIKRIIKTSGQVVRQDTFVTKFKPWPNIYLHNPRTPVPASPKIR